MTNPAITPAVVGVPANDGWWNAQVYNQFNYLYNTWETYTPAIANGGTATFSTANGYYRTMGDLVFVSAYMVCSAAGSGTTAVTLSLPVAPYRGPTANLRQMIPGHIGAVSVGVSGTYTGLIIASGSGAVIDKLTSYNAVDLQGSYLQNNTILTFEGWYRKA